MSNSGVAFVKVPIANLLRIANPFTDPPWDCRSFTPDEVWDAIEKEAFQVKPVPNWYPVIDQIERIAFLVVTGWDEKELPLFDVGLPGRTFNKLWPIEDGNHRVCAAAVRGDEFITMILSGDIETLEELLDIKIPDDDIMWD